MPKSSRRPSAVEKRKRSVERARTGQNQQPVRAERVIEVELKRFLEEDLDEYEDPNDPPVYWMAEWFVRGSSSSTEGTDEDLQTLVGDVQWAWGPGAQLIWTLDGDAPPGQTVADAVAEAGVSLPDSVSTP
jgi:hypothetical protein